VNFYTDWGIAEIDFVPPTVVSSDDRVRHLGFAPCDRTVCTRRDRDPDAIKSAAHAMLLGGPIVSGFSARPMDR
jgi:hypothetical protein